MDDPKTQKNREQLEEELDKTIQDFIKKRKKKKILVIFYVVVSIPAVFLIFNLWWAIYLYGIDGESSIGNTLQFINVTLLLSLTVIVLTFYFIDKKLERSDEDKKDRKSKIKNLSKFDKFAAILIIFGCIFIGTSLFIGEFLLFFLGSNVFTNVFIVLEYIGLGLTIIGSIFLLV